MGFLTNGWFTLIARILIEQRQDEPEESPLLTRKSLAALLEPTKCVVCGDHSQTAGVLHGAT